MRISEPVWEGWVNFLQHGGWLDFDQMVVVVSCSIIEFSALFLLFTYYVIL